MTSNDILRHRLGNEQLSTQQFQFAHEIVSWFGAVQSQDFAGAKWAIGMRLSGSKDRDIEKAFNEGKIIRTHSMRPTWHFVPLEDIRWMQELTGPRIRAAMTPYFRQFGLDSSVFSKSISIIKKALQGGQPLTRNEIKIRLNQEGLLVDGTGLAFVVTEAEIQALICSGPRIGKQFTYMLVEDRVPHALSLTRDESIKELTWRYFRSHGPATVRDFAWWSGLTMVDAKAGIQMNDTLLEKSIVNGRNYWYVQSAPQEMPETVYLLPNYDEYTVAYKDREDYFDPQLVATLPARDSVAFGHMMVYQGRIVGIWKREIKKNTVVITTRVLQTLTDQQESLVSEAMKRYGEFLGLEIVVQKSSL